MKRFAVLVIVVFGAVFLFSEKSRRDQQSELNARIARDIYEQRIRSEAKIGPSPAELIANPPDLPIREVYAPPQLKLMPASDKSYANEFSEQFERGQMRREIDSLKRQADLDQLNRQVERRNEEMRAARKEREHFLGLDYPQ